MAGSKKAGTLVDPAKSKAKAKKAKDEGPKRATTSYILFCKDKRVDVTRDHPELKGKDVLKELGRMWGELNDEEKQPYIRMYEEEKARYDRELQAMGGRKKEAEKSDADDKPKRKTTKSPKRSAETHSKSPKRSRSKSPPKQKMEAGRKGPKAVTADCEGEEDEKKMKKGRKKGGNGGGW